LIFLSKSPVDAKDKVGNACRERPSRFILQSLILGWQEKTQRAYHSQTEHNLGMTETDIQAAVAVFAEIGILSTQRNVLTEYNFQNTDIK
jgi:hypothetical protein